MPISQKQMVERRKNRPGCKSGITLTKQGGSGVFQTNFIRTMAKSFKCSYCNGTGKDYYELLTEKSACLVCKGTGTVEVEEPIIKCVFCQGTGKNPLGSRVACIVCLGKGMVYSPGESVCTACKGSGRLGDGLPCTKCKGKGMIM